MCFCNRSSFTFAAASLLLVQIVSAESQPAKSLNLYGFCMELPAVPDPSIADQARTLRELGYDGVGYPLWLDDNLEANLRVLDREGLELYLVYMTINLDSPQSVFDPRVPQALAKLKGRPVTVSVLIRGMAPGDPRGMDSAVKVLRELGDLAAQYELRISIYHHVGDWTESILHALEVAKKTNHPKVGVNFNLCHWLKVDGDKDYRPVLRDHAGLIFAVTISGAVCGAEEWTNGLIQPLDRGDFDNRELLSILRQTGYDGPIGLMCYGIVDDTQEHLQRSMRIWKSWQQP